VEKFTFDFEMLARSVENFASAREEDFRFPMKLHVGQTYEVDGKHYVRFVGIDDTAWASGWLRLAVRDGFVVRPPSLADRMIPSVSDVFR
jgi:hypothetical protein